MLDILLGLEYACVLLKLECKSGRIPQIMPDYLSAKLQIKKLQQIDISLRSES